MAYRKSVIDAVAIIGEAVNIHWMLIIFVDVKVGPAIASSSEKYYVRNSHVWNALLEIILPNKTVVGFTLSIGFNAPLESNTRSESARFFSSLPSPETTGIESAVVARGRIKVAVTVVGTILLINVSSREGLVINGSYHYNWISSAAVYQVQALRALCKMGTFIGICGSCNGSQKEWNNDVELWYEHFWGVNEFKLLQVGYLLIWLLVRIDVCRWCVKELSCQKGREIGDFILFLGRIWWPAA